MTNPRNLTELCQKLGIDKKDVRIINHILKTVISDRGDRTDKSQEELEKIFIFISGFEVSDELNVLIDSCDEGRLFIRYERQIGMEVENYEKYYYFVSYADAQPDDDDEIPPEFKYWEEIMIATIDEVYD